MKDAYTESRNPEGVGLRVFQTDRRDPSDGKVPHFTVVLPCFNEEKAILESIAALRRYLRGAGPYEIIVVNDGSTDQTSELLQRAVEQDRELRVLTHTRNRGYGASLKTAILHASSELIVITDADGTYPHERITELVGMAQEAEMVVGSRTAPDAQYPLIRKLPKSFLRWYGSWIAGSSIPDLNSGLRVFPRELAKHFFYLLPDGFSFTTTITLAMLTHGMTVRFEPISYAPRIGKSKIQPVRDTLRFLYLIVRMGALFAPLRTLMPFALALLGLFSASLAYDVLVSWNLTDKTVILLMFSMNTALCALLADVIHVMNKRSILEHSGSERTTRMDRSRTAGGPHSVSTNTPAGEEPQKHVAA